MSIKITYKHVFYSCQYSFKLKMVKKEILKLRFEGIFSVLNLCDIKLLIVSLYTHFVKKKL